MEKIRLETPSKIYDGSLMSNPKLNMTPVKQNETRSKHTTYQNNAGYFTVLPSHITPPSGLTKIVNGRNPFEADLTSRLHLSTISPTVFAKVSTPLQQSPEFKWSIDELAHMRPAKIEELPMYQNSPDPEMELKAQAAIDRFFKENQIIPSPWEDREKERKPDVNMDTPSRPLDLLNSSKELSKAKKEAWSQTVLSLPMDLPQFLEDALKSYSTFTQEQNEDNDDINLSNSSLRRKLFSNDEHNSDNDSFVSSLSVEMDESMMLPCSPLKSGMFVHYTLKESLQTRRQSDKCKSLSPPYLSPIHNNETDTVKTLEQI